MTVWEDELIADLSDFLQPPQDYAELLALHRAANIAIRRLVVNAFCHPAIPAVSTKGITT